MSEPTETVTRLAAAHGWIKLSDFEHPYCDCWEAPDGQRYLIAKGQVPLITTHRAAS